MGCGCGGGNRSKIRRAQQGTKKLKSAVTKRNVKSIQQQRQIKNATGALSPKQLAAKERIKKLRQQIIRQKFNK